jgi:hypothetical protein
MQRRLYFHSYMMLNLNSGLRPHAWPGRGNALLDILRIIVRLWSGNLQQQLT